VREDHVYKQIMVRIFSGRSYRFQRYITDYEIEGDYYELEELNTYETTLSETEFYSFEDDRSEDESNLDCEFDQIIIESTNDPRVYSNEIESNHSIKVANNDIYNYNASSETYRGHSTNKPKTKPEAKNHLTGNVYPIENIKYLTNKVVGTTMKNKRWIGQTKRISSVKNQIHYNIVRTHGTNINQKALIFDMIVWDPGGER